MTSILQTPAFPIVNPLSVNELPFAGAVRVNAVHVDVTAVMVTPGVAVFTNPAGYVSVKPTPVRFDAPLGLVIVIRITLVPPARIGLVAKVLVIVGSFSAVTVRSAAAAVGSGALSNVARKAGLVLLPALEGITTDVTVQLPLGASVMFERPIVLPPVVPVPAVSAAVEPPEQLIVTDAPP